MLSETWDNRIDTFEGGAYDPALYELAGSAPSVSGPLPAITKEQVEQYRVDGYLVVERGLRSDRVEAALAGVDALISGAREGFRGVQWESRVRDRLASASMEERRGWVRKLIYFVDWDERLLSVAQDEEILQFARELFGEEPELFADQALLKPPGVGREKPWHQDKAFFDVRPGAPVLGVWIALDQVMPENGCMHIIPGSHRDGPVVHFTRRDFQICDTDVDRTRIYSVPLQPGGMLLFDGLLHHGTPANNSQLRRWALQFHYAPKSAMWRDPEQRAAYKQRRLDVFGADGKDVTC